MKVLAIDIGYGFTKAMVAPQEQVVIPSQVGPAEEIRFDNGIASGDRGISLWVDGRGFFIGELAQLQSASRAQTLDPTRTGSTEQKALFYAAASELLKTTDEEIAVVTGLPVGDYTKRGKTVLRRMLMGEHTIKRQHKHVRQFAVTNVYTVPQAIGSLYSMVLNRSGMLINNDWATSRVAIIDIGMFTVNFVLVDRLRYVEVGSDSTTNGMAEMLQKVTKELKQEYGLVDWSLQLSKVDQAVRERVIYMYGERQDITGIMDIHLQTLADTIISKARTLWGAGTDLKAVLLTGGGATELAPYVRRAYPHTETVEGDPQLANVTGYLRAGLRKFTEQRQC